MTTDFSSSYVEVQAYINGAWTSITDDAVYTDEEGRIRAGSGVVITRGKEQTEQRCPPTECDFTINNRDGKYVNYNPYSAYRGQLTYNTPVRVIAKPAIMHLEMYDRSSNSLPASAPDDTGLSITGDMELRIELQIRRPLT
ncbi:MAG TPA: hypothetical protein VMP68_08965, partial [Candidatus Eisenbacteria bacterium]|nr:hypothetical protein [Candidatus Eisenbacteria bacterium]